MADDTGDHRRTEADPVPRRLTIVVMADLPRDEEVSLHFGRCGTVARRGRDHTLRSPSARGVERRIPRSPLDILRSSVTLVSS